MVYLYKVVDTQIASLPIGYICYDTCNNEEDGWEFLVELKNCPTDALIKVNDKVIC